MKPTVTRGRKIVLLAGLVAALALVCMAQAQSGWPIARGSTDNGFFVKIVNQAEVAAQVAFTDLAGALACGQIPALTGDVTSSAGSCATTLATVTIGKGGTGTTSTLTGLVRGSASAMTAAELSGAVTTSGSNATTLATKYATLTCEGGLGDGLNAMASGTYLQRTCRNETGATLTISAIRCFTDNSGTSTLNVANDAATGLLTGAVTCTSSYANGTQSGTTTLASGDSFHFTFVADGTSKQADFVVVATR